MTRRCDIRLVPLLVAVAVVAACAVSSPPRPDQDWPPSDSPSASESAVSVPPYLLNPAVTQASIGTTVCVAGWTDTVRPPSSYTTALKAGQLAARGVTNPDLSAYEEDHLVPLALGGAPRDERNLWPEPIAQARIKDVDESRLHRDVCAGRVGLDSARLEIYAKWARSATQP